MKRFTAMLIMLALLAALAIPAYATDLGVTIIGGDTQADPQDFDNIQLGNVYEVAGYASFKPLSFNYFDSFAQYQKDMAGDHSTKDARSGKVDVLKTNNVNWNEAYQYAFWNDSGTGAEFAWLMLDITNLQKQEVNFMQEITVKVVYDDEYEYMGWVRQFNHDYETPVYRHDAGENFTCYTVDNDPNRGLFALDPENEFPIGMVYTGNYVIGCTLPNAVVESKRPLKMIVNIGGCELTYIIRK